MHFIDYIYLRSRLTRSEDYLFAEIADFVYSPVARGVDLDQIHKAAFVNARAYGTLVTRLPFHAPLQAV